MPESGRVKRRLAAVAVIGYAAPGLRDEDRLYARLTPFFDEIVEPATVEFEGRIFKRTDQSALVEFGSVVEAARCALLVQERTAAQNATSAAEAAIELRIGLNLGDLILDADDIYGDGLNIAARLAAVAEPNTIFVSGVVGDQLRGRVQAPLVDLGTKQLKNIARPVPVYRLGAEPASGVAGGTTPGAAGSPDDPAFTSRSSVAVLPFNNFGGDPEQEYFVDGITEDLIAVLASWRAFPVIARNSTFTFKGKGIDVRQAGRDLGARYVVEGSARRAGSRVRVTAQLIDATSGHHLLAEKWDREMTDLFELQDEIVAMIVGVIEPELLKVERERFASAAQRVGDAYDHYQRGLWHHYRHTREDNQKAQAFFREALALEPGYHQAVAGLALVLCNAAYLGWADEPERNYREAFDLAGRAVALEPRDPTAHFVLGLVAMYTSRADLAIDEMKQATALNPSFPAAYIVLGQLLNYAGQPDEAIRMAEKGLRLSPHDPRLFMWLVALAAAYYQLRRYEEAVAAGRRSWGLNRNWPHGLRYVVAGLAQLGRLDEASGALEQLRAFDADLAAAEAIYRRVYRRPADIEHILEGLRIAGLR